jgi:hypothetical protein
LTLWAGLLAGCDFNFQDGQNDLVSGAMAPRGQWRVAASSGMQNAAAALDGNMMTFATTAERYRTASITVDFGRPCFFNMIVLRHGAKEFGFARKVSLSVSMDGKTFTPVQTVLGTRKITYMLMFSSTTARYIRLTAEQPGSSAWAIGELYCL